jgi:hypothetical protein
VRYGYGPVGREAHITDTVGYVAWWIWPPPKRKAITDEKIGFTWDNETKSIYA